MLLRYVSESAASCHRYADVTSAPADGALPDPRPDLRLGV
jgi:hypothetical protein